MVEDGESVVRQDFSNESRVKTVMNIIGNINYEGERNWARKREKKMRWTRKGIINFPDNNFVVLLFIPSSFLIFPLYVPENSALSSPTLSPFFLNTRAISMHTHTFKCKNENGVERQSDGLIGTLKEKWERERNALCCFSNQTAHCALLVRHYIQYDLLLGYRSCT